MNAPFSLQDESESLHVRARGLETRGTVNLNVDTRVTRAMRGREIIEQDLKTYGEIRAIVRPCVS